MDFGIFLRIKVLLFLEIKEKPELKLSEISSLELSMDGVENKTQLDFRKRRRRDSGLRFFLGLAYGPETIVSFALPKMILLYFQKTSNKKLEFFYGGELSVTIFNIIFGSLSATGGVKYGIFTLETNFSIFHAPKHETNSGDILQRYTHAAFNPKAGLYIKGIWFRFGPSFILYKKYNIETWNQIEPLRRGELRYNFELLFYLKD